MGSHLAPALTRMVLIYLDIFYYMCRIHISGSLQSNSGALRLVNVCGHEIVLLEMRYVDDYMALWKYASEQSPLHDTSLAEEISNTLYTHAQDRYQLPMERDEGNKFVGLSIDLGSDGLVHTSPSTSEPQVYGDVFDFPPVIDFRSYVPVMLKRAVVVGIVHRVDQYTVAPVDKPASLKRFSRLLMEQHFPLRLIQKWALSTRGRAIPWVASSFS